MIKLSVSTLVSIFVNVMLLGSLFLVGTTLSADVQWNPWLDSNCDGVIDITDIAVIISYYGTSGTPLNTTKLLLEVQAHVDELQTKVGNLEVRLPQRGKMSIPAAAFVPDGDPQLVGDWVNEGYYIANNDDVYTAIFSAPVQLPDGVTIIRVTSYWYDTGQTDIAVGLRRGNQSVLAQHMTNVNSYASPGYGSTISTIIDYATIDNAYQYFIIVWMPPSVDTALYRLQYLVLEYNYPS